MSTKSDPTYSEVERFAHSTPNVRDRVLLLLVLETSCKLKDLLEIRFKNIEKQKVIIGGGEAFVSSKLTRLIQSFKKERGLSKDSFIFSTRQSTVMSSRRVTQIVRKLCEKRFGITLTLEDLRIISLEKRRRESAFVPETSVRHYLQQKIIEKLRRLAKEKRDLLVLDLLLTGIGSKKISNLQVKDVGRVTLKYDLQKRLLSYASQKKLNEEDYVFITRQGSHLTKERIFQIVRSIGEQAGLTISPRILQNSYYAQQIFAASGTLVERRNGQGILVYKELQ